MRALLCPAIRLQVREMQAGQRTEPGRRGEAALLLTLFAAAFAVRIIGVDYGYFHGDERVNDAAKVLTGQLVPGQHFYPPLLNYLNGIAFGVLYAGGRLLGVWSDTGAFRAQYFADPTVFHVTARLVTAALGALLAPLFYLAARGLRLPVWPAIAAGILGALLPIAVYQSHIAKGDVPLASAAVLFLVLLLARQRGGTGVWSDLALGAAAAVALSFKHSFLFLLLPLVLVHGVLLARAEGAAATARSFALSLGAVVVIWPVLNIGILLDWQNFITYQRIQSVMSVVGGSYPEAVALWAGSGFSSVLGLGPVGFAVALLFPVYLASPLCRLPQRALLACIWAALIVSVLVTLLLVGTRQPEHLWLPQAAGFALLAALALADVMRRNVAAVGLWALAVGFCGFGATVVSRQALAEPNRTDLQALLLERYADRRILTGIRLFLPQATEAFAMDQARLERLAAKYGVALPERAPERVAAADNGAALFYRRIPEVMYGLQNATDEELKGLVQAHAWPPQAEDWSLDAWLAQGFDVVVASDVDHALNDTQSRMLHAFWSDVAARCTIAAEIAPRKPLFLERRLTVFDCAAAG